MPDTTVIIHGELIDDPDGRPLGMTPNTRIADCDRTPTGGAVGWVVD